MNNDIAIKVENVSKKYTISSSKERISFGEGIRRFFKGSKTAQEEFYALKNISFEIKKGESVGIIGQNGAGKSTLLKILSRVTEPTEGRIEINGTLASVLEVGMGFHPELTGRENVYLSGSMLGMQKKHIESKFDKIVEFSGVQKFIDTPVKHYSSGMYVRLAFSVVANIDADILLFDEVLSVGDLEFQIKCRKKIRELVEKKTILLVSHNIEETINLCHRLYLMKNGEVFHNNTKETYNKYLTDSYETSNLKTNDNIGKVRLKNEERSIYKDFTEKNKSISNDIIRINSVYLKNEMLPNESKIYINNNFSVNIIFEVLKSNTYYDIGIFLSNLNNVF